MFDPRDYDGETLESDKHRIDRERECAHPIPHDHCDANPADTRECEGGCGKFFCPDHLYSVTGSGPDDCCRACSEAILADEEYERSHPQTLADVGMCEADFR